MDHVVSGFNFKTNMKYEIALMYFAIGNVVSSGRGVDLTLELQYGASYGNLFTNIHFGAATEPFGWVVRGQDGSGYNTFWNLRTDSDTLALPPGTWAPRPTFVNAEKASMVGSVGVVKQAHELSATAAAAIIQLPCKCHYADTSTQA